MPVRARPPAPEPGRASGAGPTALRRVDARGQVSLGRRAARPGQAHARRRVAATKLLTADATFFESAGAAELPVNAAAAAISVDTALYGSAAAFWIAGLRPCTADMPGACSGVDG